MHQKGVMHMTIISDSNKGCRNIDYRGSCEECESLVMLEHRRKKDGVTQVFPMCVNLQVVGRICAVGDADFDHHTLVKHAFAAGKDVGYPVHVAGWFCRGEWFKERPCTPRGESVPVCTWGSDLVLSYRPRTMKPRLRFSGEE